MPSALRELTASKVRDFLREPEAILWVFLFPLMLALVLGFAFREKPPDRTPIGVVAGPGAEPALAALSRSPGLLPRSYTAEEGRNALRTGKISLLVEPGPPVVFRFDETRPDSRVARLEAEDALQRAAGRTDRLTVRSEKITEKGARYIDFLIPGLIGMNLMGTGIWSLAFSITNARSRRVLKRLIATPMRRSDYLLSQILGRMVFLVPEILLLAGFGRLIFGVPMRGSVILFFALCLVGAMSRDDADVAAVGSLLLRRKVSGRHPAPDPGLAADGAQRRAAGRDERRPRPGPDRAAARDSRGLGDRHLYGGAEDLPLEVTARTSVFCPWRPCSPFGPFQSSASTMT
jgi:hypothetical protein